MSPSHTGRKSLHATGIPGGWKEEVVDVAGRRFDLLLPAEPDQFLDFMTESGNHPSWPDPYWAKLWPMSIELARLVLSHEWQSGTKVIEIGCGVGMAGLAALARGLDVTFSDYIPLAMELAQENAQRNGLPAGNQLWLDWREPTRHNFDIVLASEVLYDRTLHDAILQTLDSILVPHGRAWFADPGRTATEEFIPRAQEAGWMVSIVDREGRPQEQLRFNQFNRIELIRRSSPRGGSL